MPRVLKFISEKLVEILKDSGNGGNLNKSRTSLAVHQSIHDNNQRKYTFWLLKLDEMMRLTAYLFRY